MALLKVSTARNRMFYLGSTGLTPTVTISKNGAAFGALGGTITEVSGNWYKVALNTTDTNTLGDLAYLFSTGTMNATFVDQVVTDLPGDTVASVTGNVAGNVTGNLGGTLTSSERNAIADALLDRTAGIETGCTPRQGLQLIAAASAGLVTVSGNTVTITNAVAKDTNRIVATTDSVGQRTAVTTTI